MAVRTARISWVSLSAVVGEKARGQIIVMQVLYRTRKDQRSSKKPVGEIEGRGKRAAVSSPVALACFMVPPHIIMVANNAKRSAKSGTRNDRSLPTRLWVRPVLVFRVHTHDIAIRRSI